MKPTPELAELLARGEELARKGKLLREANEELAAICREVREKSLAREKRRCEKGRSGGNHR
jgi:hypothetical protein